MTIIKNIKKLKFLDFLANTDCTVTLFNDSVSEDGGFEKTKTIETKCIYTEKVRRILNAQGKQVTLNGYILIKGDIAPEMKSITNGTCFIKGNKSNIYAGYRIFNPDGTVNHTKLELQ